MKRGIDDLKVDSLLKASIIVQNIYTSRQKDSLGVLPNLTFNAQIDSTATKILLELEDALGIGESKETDTTSL